MKRITILVEGRHALFIACNKYKDPTLKKLLIPGKEAITLSSILHQPDIGDFEVDMAINNDSTAVKQKIVFPIRTKRT
jgi:hypothetical protein